MNLTGSQIKDTYEGVLNIGATGLTGSLQEITDGLGNLLNIQVSDTTINFSGIVTGNIIGTTGAAGTSGTSGSSGTSGTSGSSGINGTSGSSGTSGTSGSSGTSGTSGSSGTSGINGATGPAGATGAAAPGGASPITVEQTNTLLSTGIGATAQAGANYNILLGSCLSTINPITCTIALSTRPGGFTPNGSNSVLLNAADNNNMGNGNNNIVIGTNSNSFSNGSSTVNIGGSNYNNGGVHHVAIGQDNSNQGGNRSVLIGKGNTNQSACDDYTAIGTNNCLKESQVQAFGICNIIHLGATGTVLLGNCSIGGTGACNSVGIGSDITLSAPKAVVIGSGSRTGITSCDSVVIGPDLRIAADSCGVLIGRNAELCNGSCNSIGIFNKSNAGMGMIGNNCSIILATGDFINFGSGACNIVAMIGSNTFMNGQYGINFGFSNYNSGGTHNVFIGTQNNNQGGVCTVLIGQNNTSCSSYCNYAILGQNNVSCTDNTVLLGMCNVATKVCTGALGFNNTLGVTGAYVIGNSLTAEKQNTTHVQSLIAFGQGASLVNAIGNVTGTATVNFDNSNNQTLTLTGSTTLTFTNPIAGANYTLQVTQGGVGSYTITWPTIKWAFNNPPTLTATVGAIDVINLFYDGTNYLGTFALNFV